MAQVFLGMSGGVDSSAAAVLLLERGYCVHGLHLSLLNTLPLPENCPPEDGSDARAVAQALELPFHDLDLSERFRQTVAAYFIREYAPAPLIRRVASLKPPIPFSSALVSSVFQPRLSAYS